jgi:hypothetical protein
MSTKAEIDGMKKVVKSMTKSDLQFQIKHQHQCKLPADMLKIVKDELATRK